MKKAQHFMTTTAAAMLSLQIASAEGVKANNAQPEAAAGQKQAPGSLRGPDGFTPQESSPANGGINIRSATGSGTGCKCRGAFG